LSKSVGAKGPRSSGDKNSLAAPFFRRDPLIHAQISSRTHQGVTAARPSDHQQNVAAPSVKGVLDKLANARKKKNPESAKNFI